MQQSHYELQITNYELRITNEEGVDVHITSEAIMTKETAISTKVTERKQCDVSVTVDIPFEIVNKERETIFDALQKEATIDGFRQGKAPRNLVQQQYASVAEQKLIERLVHRGVEEAITKEHLAAIGTPQVKDLTPADKNKNMTFTLNLEVRPEVKLKSYKGLKIEKQKCEVSEQELNEHIEQYREYFGAVVPDENTVVGEKSFVVIDYEGTIGGKPLNKNKIMNELISMQRAPFPTMLTNGMLGMQKDETKTITFTFPQDYAVKAFAGKDASFTVTIREIKKQQLPTLDDAFAQQAGFESVDALKKNISSHIQKEKEKKIREDIEDQLITVLVEKNPLDVPTSVVAEELELIVKRVKQSLTQRGLTQQQVGLDDDAMQKKYMPSAERNVKVWYLFDAIAQEEKIDATQEEVDKEIQTMLEHDATHKASLQAYFADNANKAGLRLQLRHKKVLQFLLDNAKVKDVETRK